MTDYNAKIIEEFRAHHGKVGGQFDGALVLLLSTTGARSGQRRTNPLMYLEGGSHGVGEPGVLYIFASRAGAPTNPDWYHNLVANPTVTVEVGDETYEADAAPLEREERDRVYAKQEELYPGFREYQEKTTRIIPVVALRRRP